MTGRPLLFYSAWPLGYHNTEAERKAVAFADAGYDTVYVAGVGMRNPRFSNLGKMTDRLRRSWSGTTPRGPGDVRPGIRTGSLLVAPPRQLRTVRRFNARLVERRLRRMIEPAGDAVAWVRWPSPELVDALERIQPAALVYECVDAYHLTPGVTGPWVGVFEAAERRLVAQADAVVVACEPLAERFGAWGARPILLRHGVDPFPEPEPAAATRSRHGTAQLGFVGTLDYRLDTEVLRHLAERRPEWHVRLVGPVQEGFDRRRVEALPSVTVEPAVPTARLPETLASFDVGLMPYAADPLYLHMCPVKNLELLAAGKPAVARPTPALMRYEELLYLAETPDEFERQVSRALAEDTPARTEARRAAARAESWERRLTEALEIVERALAHQVTGPPGPGSVRAPD